MSDKRKLHSWFLLSASLVCVHRSTVMMTTACWWETGERLQTGFTQDSGWAAGTFCASGQKVGPSATASVGSLLPLHAQVRAPSRVRQRDERSDFISCGLIDSFEDLFYWHDAFWKECQLHVITRFKGTLSWNHMASHKHPTALISFASVSSSRPHQECPNFLSKP